MNSAASGTGPKAAQASSSKKKRSPSYPRISLDRAVSLAGLIYESAYDSAVDTDTAMKLMGYGGRSGPSAAALSSLKQYGLIEGRDQALRITPLALQIIHPTNQSEKSEALKQALFQPEIYSEIKAVFGTKIPADQVVRSHLVRNHGFHPNGADKLIKILKENRNYAEGGAVSQQGDLNRVSHSAVESDDDQATFESELPEAGSPVISLLEKKGETLQFRASQKCVVNIRFDGELSQSAISKTIAFLELLQDNYPE